MNSVELVAVTREKVNDMYRYIEYSLPCINEESQTTQRIVARYWPNMPKCRFSLLEEGKKIAIRGHLDMKKDYGTILVVELFDVL